MKRDEALKLLDEKAWDTSDKAVKEVTRYQSNPGQASAYMIGQLKIWQIRNETKAKIEANRKIFSEKDFHYQVLSQGSSPLSYLESHMKKYVDCVIQSEPDNCKYITGSPRDLDSDVRTSVAKKPSKPLQDQPYDEHRD